MRIAGIDPGISGGFATIDTETGEVYTAAIPTMAAPKTGKQEFDLPAIRELLLRRTLDHVVIERVNAAPISIRRRGAAVVQQQHQSPASMFSFGRGYGVLLGMLVALRIPYSQVMPQVWKKQVLVGTKQDKQAAVTFCQSAFPAANLKATQRSRTPHDGICDALCLAEYGRRVHSGTLKRQTKAPKAKSPD